MFISKSVKKIPSRWGSLSEISLFTMSLPPAHITVCLPLFPWRQVFLSWPVWHLVHLICDISAEQVHLCYSLLLVILHIHLVHWVHTSEIIFLPWVTWEIPIRKYDWVSSHVPSAALQYNSYLYDICIGNISEYTHSCMLFNVLTEMTHVNDHGRSLAVSLVLRPSQGFSALTHVRV